jgi:GT2 family glycosyltransferase
MKPLNIITVAWNNRAFITPWFWHLRHETRIPTRVVFIDNGSQDGTWEEANQHKRQNDLFLQFPKNIGLGLALNAATRLIYEEDPSQEFFAFIESDIFLGQEDVIAIALDSLTKDKNAFMACLKLHRTRTGEIHYGVGGSVIRMSSWRRAGGFVFGYHLYNEDNEFCCACEKFGQHRIEMDSGICLHIGGGTTIDNLGEKRDALAHEDSLMYEMRHGFKP